MNIGYDYIGGIMNYVDLIFNKNTKFDTSYLFYGVFISIGEKSGLKDEFLNILSDVKRYDSYEILRKRYQELNEGYSQHSFIVKTYDNIYFLKIILMDSYIYDVMIYKNIDIDNIQKIFFQEIDTIPSNLTSYIDDLVPSAIIERSCENLIIKKASKAFWNIIGYEDWDYMNKYQNILNFLIKENNNFNPLVIETKEKSIKELSFDIIEDKKYLIIKEK